ncbi:Ldh family oxidoreductase [Bacillus sp. UMB0893]|uniref:Ldh family oxidoreductase n=1 Tax=Bacillus sp. UMB0893 TaxID=2066053 RepID=UPI000C7760E5|nr:Ldh family oxidoreductase [Bacillus sp. UMB0893]PLR69201.1 lactate dehydrogenase [Bacillus sp. UMB0893]
MKQYAEADLKRFCESVLMRIGMNQDNALIISDSLIKANLEGIDSHGISRLPIYSKRFNDNRITLNPKIRFDEQSSSALIVDGDNGLGHVVSFFSIEKGIKMAKKSGVAAIAIRNSNHFGAASYFCQIACEHNVACIGFTNSPPGIAPWGGKHAFFGTNPIAFGFPTGDDKPVIIDLSTSIAARGKIIMAAKQGVKIPDGWAIDEDGLPTNDPEAALKGSVLPVGGAKGSALALAVEILTGVLSGAAFGPHVKNLYNDDEKNHANVGHFFILLDIEKFMNMELFFTSLKNLLNEMKMVDKKPEIEEIRYPGERRRRDEIQRRHNGIQLSPEVVEELILLGNHYRVEFPSPITNEMVL